MLFSATLTLPRSLHRKLRPAKRIPPEEDIDDMALALDQLRFRGEPAVIDLTSKAKMADKVQEAYILCPEETVDAILYSILMKSIAALSLSILERGSVWQVSGKDTGFLQCHQRCESADGDTAFVECACSADSRSKAAVAKTQIIGAIRCRSECCSGGDGCGSQRLRYSCDVTFGFAVAAHRCCCRMCDV